MTESYLHYLWSTKKYQSLELIGVHASMELEVLDPGILNRNAGPDFFNAKIRLNNLVWVGNIEIHKSSAEWYQHRHHLDDRYDSIILHIVLEDNTPIFRKNHTPLPTCIMHLNSESTETNTEQIKHTASSMPCKPINSRLQQEEIYTWLDILSRSRLLRRIEYIQLLYQKNRFSWSEVLYTLFMRYFGFGLNNDAMEALAQSLPFKYLLNERSILLRIEALILGQAGLIDSFPIESYKLELDTNYQFLRHKYQLTPLAPSRFLKARTRPANHPLPRLLQLSWLIYKKPNLHSDILSCTRIKELDTLLNQGVSPTIAQIEERKNHKTWHISSKLLHTIAINVSIPYIISYARTQLNDSLETKAQEWLINLPTEINRHTKLLTDDGIILRHASDSQATIELRTHYCEQRKCVFCPWGRRLLSTNYLG